MSNLDDHFNIRGILRRVRQSSLTARDVEAVEVVLRLAMAEAILEMADEAEEPELKAGAEVERTICRVAFAAHLMQGRFD